MYRCHQEEVANAEATDTTKPIYAGSYRLLKALLRGVFTIFIQIPDPYQLG